MKFFVFFAVGAFGAQTAHFTFYNTDEANHYDLAVVANGTAVDAQNPLEVHHVNAPDYCLRTLCKLNTANPTQLKDALASDGVTQQVVLNPPSQVLSISCEGDCVPTYGECYKDSQYVGPCCNGFCAADRCRPWNTGKN